MLHATGKTCVLYNYMQKFTSCMFHNKFLLVCPLHEHSTCHRLGCPAAVRFHTDLQLSCRMHKGMEVYVFHVPMVLSALCKGLYDIEPVLENVTGFAD